MHNRPVEGLIVGGARIPGEDIVVELGPAKPHDSAKRPHELVLQLQLLLWRRPGATTVEHKNRMVDVAIARDGIDALRDCILTADTGIAGS